ncbi:uncharacterized protein LOC124457604 [Xenia sp. Carnegie-2017]|uniref:uncharacterized protein LOC124457604 n=1 Tax=Xenia sp. Carnegie-2017 TaxID=2897299 RepID=UPI001F034AC9|nr:uncharacterized protein LOC124457604 [Xenia sp. Carnegie-2017]
MASSLVSFVKNLFPGGPRTAAFKTLASIVGFWSLEKLLESKQSYYCPTEGYTLYGGLFLFAPVLCMIILCLIFNKTFWDSFADWFRGNLRAIDLCRNCCHVLLNSLVIVFAWLIIAFASTDYLVCFCVGGKPDPEVAAKIKRFSTILAWLLLICALLLAFFYKIIVNCCCSRVTLFPDYKRIEALAVLKTLRKEAKRKVEEEGEQKAKNILETNDNKSALVVVDEAEKWYKNKYLRVNNNFCSYEDVKETDEEDNTPKQILIF